MAKQWSVSTVQMSLVFCIIFLIVPSATLAQWDDRSDELPMDSDSSIAKTLEIVAAGLAVTGLTLWLINKNSESGEKPDKVEKEDMDNSDDNDPLNFQTRSQPDDLQHQNRSIFWRPVAGLFRNEVAVGVYLKL